MEIIFFFIFFYSFAMIYHRVFDTIKILYFFYFTLWQIFFYAYEINEKLLHKTIGPRIETYYLQARKILSSNNFVTLSQIRNKPYIKKIIFISLYCSNIEVINCNYYFDRYATQCMCASTSHNPCAHVQQVIEILALLVYVLMIYTPLN
jgi:hypothetical protein